MVQTIKFQWTGKLSDRPTNEAIDEMKNFSKFLDIDLIDRELLKRFNLTMDTKLNFKIEP